MIIETYFAQVNSDISRGNRFMFVTHDIHDFSHPSGNQKLPHPDFAPFFADKKSKYFISLSEALNNIKPRVIPNMILEREAFDRSPRTLSDILQAEDELVTKIRYNRHQIRREKIEEGSIIIIDDKDFKPETSQTTITKSIWKGAQVSAARVEKRFKGERLAWDDFEWGMLNGKLSALRWVLGEEWDEIYT